MIESASADLTANLFGNPHSDSTPSVLSSHRVEAVRLEALRFFNASPEHFDLIFVPNATAGIKLVMESFRDYAATQHAQRGVHRRVGSALMGKQPGSFWYGYHRDAHSSIVGVREVTGGTHRCFNNDREVEDWITGTQSCKARKRGRRKGRVGLFAFPGQSNMTGRRLPLDW